MGLFSKIKKAVKKVAGAADVAGIMGSDGKPKDSQAAAVQAPAATAVETPTVTPVDDTNTDGEAGKKASTARGKRNLQVARSQGTGVNI